MSTKILLVVASLVLSVLIGLSLARGNRATQPTDDKQHLIGLSLDTLKEARWQADRDMFVRAGQGARRARPCLSANGDDTVQISDVEKLITNGVDVLVIVPHDGTAMAKAVRMAHEAGIPVIAYDRIIRDSDLDLYVSFDNVRVGELQASTSSSTCPSRQGPHRAHLRRQDRQQRAALQAGPGQRAQAVHRARRHCRRARGLGGGLEAGERQAHRQRRHHRARPTPSTRCSPATTAPPAAPSRRCPKKASPARCWSPARTPSSSPASASSAARRR